MAGRTWLVGVLAVVVVAGFGGLAWATWGGGGPDYGHALVRFDQYQGQANRYVNLSDARAQLSIGSPDRHRIVYQFRDPDGHGWTAPHTVWTEKRLLAAGTSVRYGSGTVGIIEAFAPNDTDEDDSRDKIAGIVCREVHCVAKRVPGTAGTPQVAPDGKTALLGEDERGVVMWTARRGIHRLRWSGHPSDAYDVRSTEPAVLAPDGSLRVVSAAAAKHTCNLELFTSGVDSADLTGVTRHPARALARNTSQSLSQCGANFDTPFSSDWLAVHRDDPGVPEFWFIRKGTTWATTSDDPSGLQPLDRGNSCCSTGIGTFVHWNELAVGSPDGRHIQLQYHLLGQQTWSKPLLIDGAPAAYDCGFPDPRGVGRRGVVVLMECRPGTGLDTFGAQGSAYAVAVSTDYRHWQTRFVTDVRGPPRFDDDKLVVGDTTWVPGQGLTSS